jgi:gluconolactonase
LQEEEKKMLSKDLGLLVACAALAAVSLTLSTVSAAQGPSASAPAAAPAPPPPVIPPSLPPSYVVNLMTPEGIAAFGTQWKNMDAKIVEGPAMPGAGAKWKTAYDIQPHAGESGFDDSSWPTIGAKELDERRGGGKVFFTWYRANLTIPARIGEFDTAGATAVLSVLVDDYAEVWVNGQMPRRSGYLSPATIQGLNMPNRVVLAGAVKAGDRFQVAIFGINGPISVAPLNTVWFREAKIEFYR